MSFLQRIRRPSGQEKVSALRAQVRQRDQADDAHRLHPPRGPQVPARRRQGPDAGHAAGQARQPRQGQPRQGGQVTRTSRGLVPEICSQYC